MYNIKRWIDCSLLQWFEQWHGVKRIYCGTSKEWDDWQVKYKSEHPMLNWVYSLIENMQDIVNYPSDKLCEFTNYLRNKYITKPHIVSTGLTPGEWHPTDDRMIHAMFSLLVDFIEVDKASMWDLCESKEHIHPQHWYSISRSQELGLQYIDWELTQMGESGGYAQAAKEQLELYNWWTGVRINRVDPHVSTGYSDYCKTQHWDKWHHDNYVMSDMLRQIREIQNNYDAEDTEKMIQLIRIRHTLCT